MSHRDYGQVIPATGLPMHGGPDAMGGTYETTQGSALFDEDEACGLQDTPFALAVILANLADLAIAGFVDAMAGHLPF